MTGKRSLSSAGIALSGPPNVEFCVFAALGNRLHCSSSIWKSERKSKVVNPFWDVQFFLNSPGPTFQGNNVYAGSTVYGTSLVAATEDKIQALRL